MQLGCQAQASRTSTSLCAACTSMAMPWRAHTRTCLTCNNTFTRQSAHTHQDAAAVGDYNGMHFVGWPIADHLRLQSQAPNVVSTREHAAVSALQLCMPHASAAGRALKPS